MEDFKDLRNDPEFQKKYELGLKRITLVCCVIAIILAIPLFWFIDSKNYHLFIFTYLILVIIGVRFSPKIVDKIWKY